MILNDRQIENHKIVDPFLNKQVSSGVISYGVSSYGYDLRVDNEFLVFHNVHNVTIDPKNMKTESFVRVEGDYCDIPPNSFALAKSVETIHMPDNVIAICIGKSTYARCGIIVNVTPLEPGWHGKVTIEISNSTPLPVRVHAREGIMQAIFFRGAACATNYYSRSGKYQGQSEITLPIVEKEE